MKLINHLQSLANLDITKQVRVAIDIIIGFIGGLLFFLIEGILTSLNSSIYNYYNEIVWPFISSTGLNTILALVSFYIGAFLSILTIDLIFKRYSITQKFLLSFCSLGLIWWYLWSIRDWWFFN